MPNLSALRLCLDRIETSPVSTPTTRSEGSPASMSGSGLSRSTQFSDRGSRLLHSAQWSDPPSDRLQSKLSTLSEDGLDDRDEQAQHDDDDDEQRVSSDNAALTGGARDSGRLPSLPQSSRTHSLVAGTTSVSLQPFPVPSSHLRGFSHHNPHMTQSLSSSPPVPPSQRLLAVLMSSKELREAFRVTQSWRKRRRESGQQSSPSVHSSASASLRHMRAIRAAVTRHINPSSNSERVQLRHDRRQRYAAMLQLPPLSRPAAPDTAASSPLMPPLPVAATSFSSSQPLTMAMPVSERPAARSSEPRLLEHPVQPRPASHPAPQLSKSEETEAEQKQAAAAAALRQEAEATLRKAEEQRRWEAEELSRAEEAQRAAKRRKEEEDAIAEQQQLERDKRSEEEEQQRRQAEAEQARRQEEERVMLEEARRLQAEEEERQRLRQEQEAEQRRKREEEEENNRRRQREQQAELEAAERRREEEEAQHRSQQEQAAAHMAEQKRRGEEEENQRRRRQEQQAEQAELLLAQERERDSHSLPAAQEQQPQTSAEAAAGQAEAEAVMQQKDAAAEPQPDQSPAALPPAGKAGLPAARDSVSLARGSPLLTNSPKPPIARSRASIISRAFPAAIGDEAETAAAAVLPELQPLSLDSQAADTASQAPAAPAAVKPGSWIQGEDRDALFSSLAEEMEIFSRDVSLSNRALNSLLTAAGSREAAIALCHEVETLGKQVDTVQQLCDLIKEMKKEQEARTAAVAAADNLIPAPAPAAPPAVVAPPPASAPVVTASSVPVAQAASGDWVTSDDRDALFDFLAGDEAAALFSVDVKLSNRALDKMLRAGGSREATFAALREMEARQLSFPTVDALIAGMQLHAQLQPNPPPASALPAAALPRPPSAQPEPAAPPSQPPAPPAPAPAQAVSEDLLPSLPQPQLSVPPVAEAVVATPQPRVSVFSFPQPVEAVPLPPAASESFPAVSAGSQWVTERDREQLRSYFSAPQTSIFSAPVTLPPEALTAMLAVTGSAYVCIEALLSIQKKGLLFPHPAPLLAALQHEMSLLTTSGLPQPLNPSARVPSPHAENRAARDALFQYLSSPYCHLFSASVKLNNFTLDHLLFQGRGLPSTLACCHFLDELGRQFASVELLVDAVKELEGRREEQEAELLRLLSHPQHQKALFPQPVAVDAEQVRRLYVSVQAAADTKAYVLLIEEDVILHGRERLRSVEELRHEVQRRHAATRLERRKEMERLYEWLHLPVRRVLGQGAMVSMEDCARLTMAGREDLRAERGSAALRIIGEMEGQHEQADSVDDLLRRIEERRKAKASSAVDKAAAAATIPSPTPAAAPPPAPAPAAPTPSAAVSSQKAPAAAASLPQRWVTAKDRDAMFEYLASDECELFNSNVTISNRALDAMLTAGGSLKDAMAAARAFNSEKRRFESVDGLRDAIAARVSNEKTAAAATAESASAALLPVSAEDRDAVFTVLAEDTNLFLSDVKLSNRNLDAIIRAAGGREQTVAALHAHHRKSMHFANIPALITALSATPATAALPETAVEASAASVSAAPARELTERDALWAWLSSDDCSLFDAVVSFGDAELDGLLREGKGLSSTLTLLRRLQQSQQRYSSVHSLRFLLTALASLPALPAPPAASSFTAADRDALFEHLASDSCTLFSTDVKLSNAALDRLLAPARGLRPALSILSSLNTTSRQFASLPLLVSAVAAEYEAAYDALAQLLIFFSTPPSVLLPTPSPDAILDFYWDAEMGADSLLHVRAVAASGPFSSLADMLPLVTASRMTQLMQTNSELALLHQLVAEAGGAGKGCLRGVAAVSVWDCHRLARAGRAELEPSRSPEYVKGWTEAQRQFSSVDVLLETIKSRFQQELRERIQPKPRVPPTRAAPSAAAAAAVSAAS